MLPRDATILANLLHELAHGGTPITRGAPFRDEAGNSYAADPALLVSLQGGSLPPLALPSTRDRSLELWWLAAGAGDPAVVPSMLTDRGPLAPELAPEGIEVWTQAELSALHALSIVAGRSIGAARPALLDRCDRHAEFLIRELQPDNATNHPWGVHVFLRRWSIAEDHDACLYADALLHNCRVMHARPDRRSALILESASRTLPAIH